MAGRMGENSAPVSYASLINERSVNFCRAFAQGCGGSISNRSDMLLPGAVAGFWLPELFSILNAAKADGRTWYYGDKAYFDRNHYWRITKNAAMHNCSGHHTPIRFERLKIQIKPWRPGSEIMICPQSEVFFQLQGMTQKGWIDSVTAKIRKYTDRKIVIHHKRTGHDTEQHFANHVVHAWAVVVHSSMAGAQATLHGVPCFATDPYCVSAKFGSTDLSKIEYPVKPDNRAQLAWALADNQWTLDEIKRGIAWEAIK